MNEHKCPRCNTEVSKERWDAGFQYCKDPICFMEYGKNIPIHETGPSVDGPSVVSIFEIYDENDPD